MGGCCMNAVDRDSAEQLSALVDGETGALDVASHAQLIHGAARSETLALRWARYQSIGDMMRSAELAPTARDETFMTRMRLSLAAEPVVVAPANHAEWDVRIGANSPVDDRKVANGFGNGLAAQRGRAGMAASILSHKSIALLGGLAVLSAAVLGWSAWRAGSGATLSRGTVELSQSNKPLAVPAGATAASSSTATLVSEPELVVVQTANGRVIRDARLDQYFAAHNGVRSGGGLGAGASMAAPAAFVRGAAVDSAASQ